MLTLLLLLAAAAEVTDTGADTADSGSLDTGWGPRVPLHGEDSDDDSWPDSVDCAPEDPAIYPGAPEQCNGLDDDCNGEVDDIPEVCDGVDNDCDGKVDEAEQCRACGGEPEVYRAGMSLWLLIPLWCIRRRRLT